jgi:hypothetical protein
MESTLQPGPASRQSKAQLEKAIHLLELGEKTAPKTTV